MIIVNFNWFVRVVPVDYIFSNLNHAPFYRFYLLGIFIYSLYVIKILFNHVNVVEKIVLI